MLLIQDQKSNRYDSTHYHRILAKIFEFDRHIEHIFVILKVIVDSLNMFKNSGFQRN